MTSSELRLVLSRPEFAFRLKLAFGSGLALSELRLTLSYILSHWLLGLTILVLFLLSILFLRVFISALYL